MKINEVHHSLLNETYYDISHPSGLKILVMPKEGYSGAYAIFATKYGSIDNEIPTSDGYKTIPEGTAHFLEHKLFESEDLDAFERFAKTGASANAYTSFDRTGYLFSCSGNFRQNLEILLDFVQHPYFTQATVEKEQGIIGQEIMMYKDVPDWEIMFNLFRAMYHNHPLRTDIAGTCESIAQISADLLYDCYNNFYNLGNMVLAIAGNVDVQDVIDVADRVLVKKDESKMVERKAPDEPKEVVSHYTEERLSVASPQFMLGYKQTHPSPVISTEYELAMEILLDVIAGASSPLYKRLLEKELINTSFSYEYFTGFGYSAVLFGGESANPKEVEKELKAEIEKYKQTGISQKDFSRIRKKLYGRMIMSFNDIDEIANNMAVSYFWDEDVFTDFDKYQNVTLELVNDVLKNSLQEEFSSLSVILPMEDK